MKTEFKATAIWLRSMGGEHNGRVEVLVEIDGKWRKAIVESINGSFSHIAEGNGVDSWKDDNL